MLAPALTLPDAEAHLLLKTYARAKVILEYGSGGSTALAAELGAKVMSVESDRQWARDLATYLATSHPDADAVIHYAGIGPTKKWGHPRHWREEHIQKYRRYPRSVWRRDDFEPPDTVLIDGRFRVGCFLHVLKKIKRPTRVLFDDYRNRDSYHFVERYAKPVEICGRMAVFDLEPRRFNAFEKAANAPEIVKPL